MERFCYLSEVVVISVILVCGRFFFWWVRLGNEFWLIGG